MDFRNEYKHEITAIDCISLRSRLSAVLKPDSNGNNGRYEIRSLYFDDLSDTALKEKINGVNLREKFRIRYYNRDTSFIRLEKKSKINGLCNKQSASISAEEAQRIIEGDIEWMKYSKESLVRELYVKMKTKGIRPKTIVDYTRDAFIFPAGNVRVTLDYNIRSALSCTDMLNPDCVTVPVGDSYGVLEVKWDGYLPDLVKDLVQTEGLRTGAFSKYAVCRIYG